ncbi:MAG: hypothetical protein ABIP48_26175 [Planctomycetota bacterium]
MGISEHDQDSHSSPCVGATPRASSTTSAITVTARPRGPQLPRPRRGQDVTQVQVQVRHWRGQDVTQVRVRRWRGQGLQ